MKLPLILPMDSRLKQRSRFRVDVAQTHCMPVSIFGAISMGVPLESSASYQLPPRALMRRTVAM
jgi:hypothetical protein